MPNFKSMILQKLFEAKKKQGIKIPENLQDKFNELMDKYMDTHNMTGEAAYQKAVSELGLDKQQNISEGSLGYRKGKRAAASRAKHGGAETKEKVKRVIMKKGFRAGMEDYNLNAIREREQEFGTSESSQKMKKSRILNRIEHEAHISLLGKAAYPMPEKGSKVSQSSMRQKRMELKSAGNRTKNKTTAHARAEEIYNQQPAVDAKAKDIFLRRVYREQELKDKK